MKVMDAIKRGFGIAAKNINLILIIFVVNLIFAWIMIPFTPEAPLGAQVTIPPAVFLLTIVFILISIFIQGGMLASIRDIIKEGKTQINKFAGYGGKFYVRLLCLGILLLIVFLILGLVIVFVVAAAIPSKNAVLIVLASVAALVLLLGAIALMIFVMFSPYILVIEDAGIMGAIRMSVDFAKNLFLKILGLGAILFLVSLGIGLLFGLVAGALSLVIKGRGLQFVMGIINSGVNSYITVAVASAFAAYYLGSKGALKKTAPSE